MGRNPLRLHGPWLAALFTGTNLLAATDPFVGTWIYNNQKSPKPTKRYAIKDLGGERYSLTGSTGVTVESKPMAFQSKRPPEVLSLSRSSMSMTGKWSETTARKWCVLTIFQRTTRL
jgi:hypothetical protein